MEDEAPECDAGVDAATMAMFQALARAAGLNDLEGRVLAVVVEAHEVSAGLLGAATGARLPAISVAVNSLVRRGLLERLDGRRPSTIFLSPGAPAVVDRLLRAETSALEARGDLAAEARTAVVEAARLREQRGRPYHELEPLTRARGFGLDWPQRRGKTAHLQVARAVDASRWLAPLSLGCPVQLLVVQDATASGAVASGVLRLSRLQLPGSEVRLTTEELPRVWILDGQRAGVAAGTRDGFRLVWSRDQQLVRAARELFSLWWDRADPGLVTPIRAVRTEEDLEVEEWDPEELPVGCPEVSG